MQRVAKAEPDVDGARTFALEVARKYLRKDYPDWWGPVADLYVELGLHLDVIKDRKGNACGVYRLFPGAGRVLANEALADAEAFDLALNVCVSSIEAREAVPVGMEEFAAGVLRGTIRCPERPTNTPVKHWKRDSTLFFLTFHLRERFGLEATPRRRLTENEATRKHGRVPSAPSIIADAFRLAGVPLTDGTGIQITETTAAKVWGDKNVPKRLEDARRKRSKRFHELRAEFFADVPDVTEVGPR